MSTAPTLPAEPTRRLAASGKLAENVMHFARVLRAAGLPVGPNKVLDALAAVEVAGVDRREDFYWTLASVLIDRREQFEIFDQAFHIFWRDPQLLERIMSLFLPKVYGKGDDEAPQPSNRLAEALAPPPDVQEREQEREEKVEIDMAFTVSEREVLQHADFETMTGEELAQAKKLIAELRLPIPEVCTRRLHRDSRGRRIDMRATMQASLRTGGAIIPLQRLTQEKRHPPLVVLCDISGSMSRYSRMFLHFMHAITNDRDRVYTFVFGTRLTNITRNLKHRDVDVALNSVSDAVADWSGGTRIGSSLREFNLRWSRRVLGQNAVMLMITDGLDRDLGKDLSVEMERLHKSCHRLIWLNPLLRYEAFEARPAGIRAMLPHVDSFLPAHNIESLRELSKVLSSQPKKSTRIVSAGRVQ
ncbi:MAG: VWA domain-containing protein [Betaproteobacteria bacterium]|nr:VWA domain-containing protein [Betaproteobacteria bacterium]